MNPLSKEYQTRRANRVGEKSRTISTASSGGSSGERDFVKYLQMRELQGELTNIRHHPASVQLTKKVKWNIDFIVFEHKRQCEIAIDYKGGFEDGRFKTLLQLWPEFGPMPVQIWTRVKGRFVMVKEIKGAK